MEAVLKDVKNIMKDVENFLTMVLKKEKLSKDATKKKEDLLTKVSGLRTKIDSEEKEKVQAEMKSNTAVVPQEPDEEYADVEVPEPQNSGDTNIDEGIMDELYEEAGSTDLAQLSTKTATDSGPGVETDSIADDNKSLDDVLIYDESKLLNVKPTAASDLNLPLKSGYLEKKRKGQRGFSTWQKRWCVVKDNLFYYYNKPSDKKQKNVVCLLGYEAKHAPHAAEKKKKENCFEITHPENRPFQFVASNKKEMDEWIEAIHKASKAESESDSGAKPIEDDGETYEDVAQPAAITEELYEVAEEEPKPKEKPVVIIEPNKSVLFNEILPKHETKKEEVVTKTTVPVMQCSNWEYDYNEIYVAMWDCKGSQNEELSFKRGEFVHIINKLDEFADYKWWIGETKDKVGFLPKEYVMKAYDLDI
ncbi:src kinase-associated phosphoprotein 2-B-like isoform X2 [Glandiceps talaboti]